MNRQENTAIWLKLPQSVSRDSGAIALELEEKVRERLRKGEFTEEEAGHVAELDMHPVKGALQVSNDQLERLRRLCQVWDVDIRPGEITSHRPIIGRFIVAGKKLFFPIIRALLKNYLSQQREFNAAAISLLADLCSKNSASR